MDDFSVAEHRLVVIKPGDILVIQHTSEMTQAVANSFKAASGASLIVSLPKDIDIATVRPPATDGR